MQHWSFFSFFFLGECCVVGQSGGRLVGLSRGLRCPRRPPRPLPTPRPQNRTARFIQPESFLFLLESKLERDRDTAARVATRTHVRRRNRIPALSLSHCQKRFLRFGNVSVNLAQPHLHVSRCAAHTPRLSQLCVSKSTPSRGFPPKSVSRESRRAYIHHVSLLFFFNFFFFEKLAY